MKTGNIAIGIASLLMILGLIYTIITTFHIGASQIELVYIGLGIFVWFFAALITYAALYDEYSTHTYSEGLVVILVYIGYGSLYLIGAIYLSKYLWGF
jgi:hypothetical protein